MTFTGSVFAQERYSYNAKIQCGNSSTTANEFFSASSDIEAKNEVSRLLNNNTGYRGKSCRLIELTSNAPQKQQASTSYEVKIKCRNSSGQNTEFFSANSDLDAENEARRILNSNSGYSGKGCQITEITRR